MWTYILVILFIPVCYISWILIHEFSHLYVANKLVGIQNWRLDLIPKITFKPFHAQFGYCYYTLKKQPRSSEHASICVAPRYPDLIGTFLLPFTCYIPEPFFLFAIMFFSGAIVDLFVGSLGISEKSDLRKMCNYLDASPWMFRIMGFLIIILSTAKTIQLLSEVKGWF